MPVAVAACVLTAIAWVYLAACHGGYWRTDQRLPPARGDPAAWPAVTAVIPARDEAAVLPGTMPTLLAQDYPGKLRVVLVDDQSSDGTAALAAALGRAAMPVHRSRAADRAARTAPAAGMIARSAYTQLRYSPAMLAGTIAGLLWIYLLPPAAAVSGLAWIAAGGGAAAGLIAVAGLVSWAIMAITYVPMLRLYGLSPLRAAGLPLIAALYAAMTVDAARRHRAGRGGQWKGRTIGA